MHDNSILKEVLSLPTCSHSSSLHSNHRVYIPSGTRILCPNLCTRHERFRKIRCQPTISRDTPAHGTPHRSLVHREPRAFEHELNPLSQSTKTKHVLRIMQDRCFQILENSCFAGARKWPTAYVSRIIYNNTRMDAKRFNIWSSLVSVLVVLEVYYIFRKLSSVRVL